MATKASDIKRAGDPVRLKQDARRSDVARAALAVIAQAGLDGMSMRAIAAEMGCSTGVLTHYFRDKVQLVRFVLDWLNDDLMAKFGDAPVPRSVDELVDDILAILPHDADRRVLWRGFLNFTVAALNESQLAEDEARRSQVIVGWLQGTLQDMRRAGVFQRPLDAEQEARFLLALVDGLGLHALLTPAQFTKAKVRDHLRRHLKALAAPA
ncbi:TetR family transcriptional regulator C-terminal domain-containing protein [Phenylobacterium sp.]|uniref:TetR/AcrR family transcriptional regulator n=1 Tax=Phenylobacterium sp. TaxID=1871053 RepID=UPI0025F8E9D2|nr:TetR family transcriptional regulator C-terminal domain-containing protein [Phenylobacterium sp.]